MRGIGVAVMCSTWGLAVGAGLGVERRPLADPEAVLLVDHGDGEAGKAHGILDQGMGPDQEGELTGGELPEQVVATPRRGRAGEQADRHRLAGHQRLQGGEVLLGQGLGRRHQRPLGAMLDRAQQRVEGDDRLAGSHLPHQQPLHRLRRRRGLRRAPRWRRPDRQSGRREASSTASARSVRGVDRAPSRWPRCRRSRRRRRSASWASRSSSKARRRRPRACSDSPPVRCTAASALRRSGRRSRTRKPAGRGSVTSSMAPAWARTRARIWVEDSPSVAA